MYDYRITVPGGVFIVFRAFAILEGIGKLMYPEFKTYDFIRPYGQRLLTEQLKPENLMTETVSRFSDMFSFMSSLPVDIKNIMQKANNGKLHMEIELQGYGYALKKWDSITNRLAITYIIAALIIGSSIALQGNYGPEMKYYYGINAWSFTGYSIAGGMFVILLYMIMRRRIYK
jgi:ubiquinone biosynthesis protein